jgi:hypothetical protein
MIQGDREGIDAYLQGTLSPAERLVFETRLQTDAVLKKETDAVTLVLPMIQLAGRMHLKTKLRSIEATLPVPLEEYMPSKNNKGKLKAKGKLSLKWWWIAVAAGIIAAAIAWYVFFYHPAHEQHGECLDCTEQTESGQPSDNENALRHIADSLYADSCRKDSLQHSPVPASDTGGVSVADVYAPEQNPFDESAGASKPKPKQPVSEKAVVSKVHKSKTLYSSAWQISDKAVISGAELKQKNPVVISVKNNGASQFHYRFTDDTLTLYGPFLRNLLFYDQSGDRLVLRYKEKYYPLPKTDKTMPLTESRASAATK